jgi:hypothetical protein
MAARRSLNPSRMVSRLEAWYTRPSVLGDMSLKKWVPVTGGLIYLE